MPQIYDMGPTALLPLRRKACWGFFRPGLNPQTWVLKASLLPLDHRSRYQNMSKNIQIWLKSASNIRHSTLRPNALRCCRRHKFAIKVFLCNAQYLYRADRHRQVSSNHIWHRRVSTATVVTWTRYNITSRVHRIFISSSFSLLFCICSSDFPLYFPFFIFLHINVPFATSSMTLRDVISRLFCHVKLRTDVSD